MSSVNGFVQVFAQHLQSGVHGIPLLKQLERPLQSELQPHLVSSIITAPYAGRDMQVHNGNVNSLVLAPAILFSERN